jgi:hypothetical protein
MAKSLVKLADEEYNKRLPRIRIRLRRYARANHRFINRTGRLSKSIGTVYSRKTRTIKTIAKIHYAKYVINGHGTWAPDRFTSEADAQNTSYIKEQFQDAVDKAVVRYNKQKGSANGSSVHNGI